MGACGESKMCNVNVESTSQRTKTAGAPPGAVQSPRSKIAGGHHRPTKATNATRPSRALSPCTCSKPALLAVVVFAGAVLVLVPVDVEDDDVVEVLVVVVATGANVRVGDVDARAQNCWASVSDEDKESEQSALTHATSSAGKFGLSGPEFTRRN